MSAEPARARSESASIERPLPFDTSAMLWIEAIISSTALEEFDTAEPWASIWPTTSRIEVRMDSTARSAAERSLLRSSPLLSCFPRSPRSPRSPRRAPRRRTEAAARALVDALSIFMRMIRLWIFAIKTLIPRDRGPTSRSPLIFMRLVRSFSPEARSATGAETPMIRDSTAAITTRAETAAGSNARTSARAGSPTSFSTAPRAPRAHAETTITAVAASTRNAVP